MMKTIFLLFAALATTSAFKPPKVTGPTPPPVACSDSQCNGKYDGNFEYVNPYTYEKNLHYFVQCSNGRASCQACWPSTLEFSPDCNQCLYSKHDQCVTTKPWKPATTLHCPDICPKFGPHFSGNVNDPYNKRQYIACWKGVTAGCIACPGALEFNRRWNACLFKGRFKQIPKGADALDYVFGFIR